MCPRLASFPGPAQLSVACSIYGRGGSAGIRNLYSYFTSSGDIRYDNRSYADSRITGTARDFNLTDYPLDLIRAEVQLEA